VMAAAREAKDIRCYIELHIEQGPVLEKEGLDIGVVSGIAGIARCEFRFRGQTNHAGSTAMDDRKDALHAAASFVDRAYRLIGENVATRMTFGTIEIKPNALNVVPGVAVLQLEIRDPSSQACAALRLECVELAHEIAKSMGICWRRLFSTTIAPSRWMMP
jgi:acetylornithine deacetylase/succinyl-diaminopimelate desuccinylase-like protein